MKKMGHPSLEMNVVKVFLKFYMHIINSKWVIRVQEIKVQKVNFNLMSLFLHLIVTITITLLIPLDSPNIHLSFGVSYVHIC